MPPNPQNTFSPFGGLTDATGRLMVTEESNKYSYRSVCVTQTLYSTAAAVLFEMTGSATMTIRVKKILMWAQAATKFFAELTLGRATAVSGGTPVTMTAGKMDKNFPAATATVQNYTAAAVAGTGFTAFDGRIVGIAAPSASMIAQPAEWDWCLNNDSR